jgi:hypothetical protein
MTSATAAAQYVRAIQDPQGRGQAHRQVHSARQLPYRYGSSIYTLGISTTCVRCLVAGRVTSGALLPTQCAYLTICGSHVLPPKPFLCLATMGRYWHLVTRFDQ